MDIGTREWEMGNVRRRIAEGSRGMVGRGKREGESPLRPFIKVGAYG